MNYDVSRKMWNTHAKVCRYGYQPATYASEAHFFLFLFSDSYLQATV